MKYYTLFIIIFLILLLIIFSEMVLAVTIPNDGPGWKAEDWDEEYPAGKNSSREFIKLPSAWDFTTGSKNIKIGIVDLGFDINHEDLKDNIIPYAVSRAHEHGTHIAGIIGAKGNNEIGIAGTMWDVTMLPYTAKVPFIEKTSSFLAIAKMWAAIMQGAKIINYSFGTDHDTLQSAKRENMIWKTLLLDRAKNKVFIFAAGEEGVDDKYSSPSSISSERDNVISAVDTNTLGEYLPGSNYGEITVATPGVLINSTLPGNSYGDKTGTSFAAPFVTGLAGLIWSKAEELGKDLTAAEVRDLIIQGAINGNKYVTGPDDHPIPIINAYESLKLLVGPPEWSLPETIHSSPEAIHGSAVTSDNLGNLHMIWLKPIWTGYYWYNELYYTKQDQAGWSEPEVIALIRANAAQPDIISDNLGYLHVVFPGRSSATIDVFYITWDGAEWSEPLNISNTPGIAQSMKIVSDSDNNLYVVWGDLSAAPTVFYVKKTNETWSEPLAISPPAAGAYRGSLEPLIVIDKNDNLHVIMHTCLSSLSSSTTNSNCPLFYTKFDGLEWSEPVNTDISSSYNSGGPDYGLAVDKFNHPHIIAKRRVAGKYGVFHTYWNGSTWTSHIDISGTERYADYARVTVDDLGNIHGIWREQSKGPPEVEYQILYNSYDGTDWSEPEIIPDIPVKCGPIDIIVDIFNYTRVIYGYSQEGVTYFSHIWR